MSFSGQSSAPWQRNNVMGSFHQGGASQQMFMHHQQQQQQQSSMSAFGHGSSAFPPGSGTVSYPRTAGLNPVAFAGQSTGGNVQSQHYNSIGTVTKMNSDCGLVNDEVIFYRNVCKGHAPKLGDRVLFEATYSGGQFKWNATRIQIMAAHQSQPQPLMGTGGKGSGYSAVPPPNTYQRSQQSRHHSPKRSSPSSRDRYVRTDRDRKDRERNRSRERDDDEHERKRRREDPERSRDRSNWSNNRGSGRNERSDSFERKDRERDRERRGDNRIERADRSPRRTRAIRRYLVRIPKNLLTYTSADVQELRQRYSTLYIPSDFFHANIKWSEFFKPGNSSLLHRPCQFHIKHKIVEPPFEQKIEELEPADADYIYSAKVMLLSCPPIAELYQKCFEDDDSENEANTVHPSRLISFLVGTRGRNEPMAIGGAWSPSLDGENPEKDPAVLIRTAIRTCRALTGIDLSNCTQWYRFVELYYHRTDYKQKSKDAEPRIETVVIYLPDIHSCMPSISEWQTLTQEYKTAVDNVISRSVATPNDADAIEDPRVKPVNTTLAKDSVTKAGDAPNNGSAAEATEEVSVSTSENDALIDEAETGNADNFSDQDAAAHDDNNEENQKDIIAVPTHHSKLYLKTMKLQAIRDELIVRDLPAKGVRNLLMARLAKALNAEKSEELNAKQVTKSIENPVNENDNNENTAKTAKPTIPKSETKKQENIKDGTAVTGKADDTDKEEQEEWSDIIDVDMSDIVILDEYDSNKNQEVLQGNADADAKFIRRYALPTDPHIIVHPNRHAKGGKFDCTSMSLSLLLDYGPEDTKERFFEVSLFAELFNEMLMRDFGFNIYKELYLHKEVNTTENTDQKDKDAKSKKGDEDRGADKPKEHNENNLNADSTREHRISKRNMDEELEEDSQSLKSGADRKRKSRALVSKDKEIVSDKKMIVVKPHLLLSFLYFDTTHCGYIFEKDLEDLFSILGLNLSRGQIRKVIGKLAVRQSFYYRKLTDREESLEAMPTIEETVDTSNVDMEKLALGNNHFDFIFNRVKCCTSAVISQNSDDGLVTYNGAVIHVGKLVDQIKRTEKNLSDVDKLYNDLRKQHTDLQKDHTKAISKIKDLQAEVKSLNRKLSDADQDLYSLNRKQREQQSTLSYIYNRVAPLFNRDKEKDHKSESSRDKDANKDKDKQKNRESKDCKQSKEKDKTKDHYDRNTDEKKKKDQNGEKEQNFEKEQSVAKEQNAENEQSIENENCDDKSAEMDTSANDDDEHEEEEEGEVENEKEEEAGDEEEAIKED